MYYYCVSICYTDDSYIHFYFIILGAFTVFLVQGHSYGHFSAY